MYGIGKSKKLRSGKPFSDRRVCLYAQRGVKDRSWLRTEGDTLLVVSDLNVRPRYTIDRLNFLLTWNVVAINFARFLRKKKINKIDSYSAIDVIEECNIMTNVIFMTREEMCRNFIKPLLSNFIILILFFRFYSQNRRVEPILRAKIKIVITLRLIRNNVTSKCWRDKHFRVFRIIFQSSKIRRKYDERSLNYHPVGGVISRSLIF